jgi:hypothetical protein
MNTFHDLFRQPTRAVGTSFPSDRRRELFPGFVERSPKLHLWSPGQPIPDRGSRLLVGVATWSGYDLNLLDLIEEAPASAVRVDVFDTDALPDLAALEHYIPGVEMAHQTPIVGHWLDGRLVETAVGFHGWHLVARVCGIPASDVDARMNSLLKRF